jgi:hypothetical protein
MKTYIVTLKHGTANALHTEGVYRANSQHEAAKKFAYDLHCIVFPLQTERPYEQDGKLYAMWSAGNDISGQRVYIKTQIG